MENGWYWAGATTTAAATAFFLAPGFASLAARGSVVAFGMTGTGLALAGGGVALAGYQAYQLGANWNQMSTTQKVGSLAVIAGGFVGGWAGYARMASRVAPPPAAAEYVPNPLMTAIGEGYGLAAEAAFANPSKPLAGGAFAALVRTGFSIEEQIALSVAFHENGGYVGNGVAVVAELRIAGRNYFDFNQMGRSSQLMTIGKTSGHAATLISSRVRDAIAKRGRAMPNGTIGTAHAEIGVIQQAFRDGVTWGADAVLTVAGKGVCNYCIGDIAAVARESGVSSLIVQSRFDNKVYYWRPGMRSIQE